MRSNILLLVKYFLLLIAGGGGLFWVYDYCVNTKGISLYYSLDTLLIFHCGLSFFLFSIIFIVNKRRKPHTAFAFMAGFVLRFIAIVLLSLPLVKIVSPSPLYEMLFILLPSFYFTTVEAVLAIRLIK
ncbi:hypothetical protein [Capnocytophaga sp. HP1101]